MWIFKVVAVLAIALFVIFSIERLTDAPQPKKPHHVIVDPGD